MNEKLVKLFTELTGQQPPLPWPDHIVTANQFLRRRAGVGWTQFNELLLLLGYDRVTQPFFQFLSDGTLAAAPRASIQSLNQFQEGVSRVREISLLFFGNVKFGFKKLSREVETLALIYAAIQKRNTKTFENRYEPVQPIETISGKDTYYLGYLIEGELRQQLAAKPHDPKLLATEAHRKLIVEVGKRNHAAYFASDHLDVYVATSMRARHEYQEIAGLCDDVFNHPKLRNLKLRWFDPTQAYCKDRVDKGLAEALMLKRAKCTLYLVQETDTLGKDSELASTLAQGKPVIAFVPRGDRRFVNDRLKALAASPDKSEADIVLGQLQLYDSGLAWTDSTVRTWLNDRTKVPLEKAKELLFTIVERHFEKRAKTLKEDHPLGIQVHLETGVANGVLVARSVNECVELIRGVITRNLKFSVETTDVGSCYLKERVSDSIYRVMTSDAMLTNAFWNFYLAPSE